MTSRKKKKKKMGITTKPNENVTSFSHFHLEDITGPYINDFTRRVKGAFNVFDDFTDEEC